MDAEPERNISFFRFEDLRIYHKALNYILWVQKKTLPFHEKDHGIVSTKLSHSAQAIAMNIAEGSARNKSQFVYYLKLSKSAIRDCLVLTSLAFNSGYFTEDDERHSREQLMEMTKMLGALIGSLQKAAGISGDEHD
ncbi:MAG: four helix bundle protein [Bacteroidales bacterium]|nr:four helix bundle protein [Bacteroidales bacterium]